MQLVWAVLIGVVGAVFLSAVYFVARTSWPGTYISLSETYALTAGQRILRVAAFRFLPVYFISLAVVVTAWRVGALDWLAIVVALGAHLVVSNLAAFWKSLRPSSMGVRVNFAGYHLLASGLVASAGVAAALSAPVVGFLVPSPKDLIANLWFAGVVAVVGAGIIKVSSKPVEDQPDFATTYFRDRALRDAGIEVFDAAFTWSVTEDIDPDLFASLLISEVMQRPSWFRRLERAKGIFMRRGTYGVMQMGASRPISDDESIRLAAQEYAGTWGCATEVQGGYWYRIIDENAVWSLAGRHHGDKPFIDSVAELYSQLIWDTVFETNGLWIKPMRRYANEIGIRGTTVWPTVIFVDPVSGSQFEHTAPANWRRGRVWAFEVRVPMTMTSANLKNPLDRKREQIDLSVTNTTLFDR